MPNKKSKILISGSLVFDRIMDFPGKFADHIMPDKIYILNVSFVVNGVRESFGGTAGNIAYNLALLGERPTILSAVGNDFASYKKWLLKNKIDCSQIKIAKNKNTASCYIMTDMSDNQITAFNPGALVCERFTREKLGFQISGRFGNRVSVLAIIAPGNARDMENYAQVYKKNKIKYIFDPGQQITSLESSTLKQCIDGAEILIGNDYEIGLVIKKTGWTMSNLIDKVRMLVVTLGVKGSLVYEGKKKHLVKAAKVKAVDPTGAGDAYRAGLVKGMIKGWPIEKAAMLGSAVASFAVEKRGTQEHKFSIRDLKERHKISYGKDLEFSIFNF